MNSQQQISVEYCTHTIDPATIETDGASNFSKTFHSYKNVNNIKFYDSFALLLIIIIGWVQHSAKRIKMMLIIDHSTKSGFEFV